MILAVDPSLTKPGAAIYDDGRLLKASRVPIRKVPAKMSVLERAILIVDQVFAWFDIPLEHSTHTLVVEYPQIYSATKSKGNPNDLLGLCVIAGVLADRIVWDKLLSPTPAQVWGNLPKTLTGDPWKSPRGHRLASRLTQEERACISKHHDALDAAGLALWAAGRWKPTRVFPGAV